MHLYSQDLHSFAAKSKEVPRCHVGFLSIFGHVCYIILDYSA